MLDDGTTTGFREESFTHDGLGRLTQAAATSGTTTRTLTTDHDVLGNLKFRMSDVTGDIDVTDYTYTDALNAVQYAKVGSTRQKYAYDDAGRMMSDRQCLQLTGTCTFSTQTDALNDRYIEWDGRDLARKIVVGSGLTDSTPTARETFRYGPDEARFERFSEWKDGEETQSMRTFYVGDYEKTFPESDADVVSVERTRLPGGVVHVKTTPTTGSATEAFEYRHVDHLGSAAVIADGTATPLAVLGNDPFGARRRADWTRELTADESAALSGRRTARGFTGHEHLDRTGFVHMNGRLYDARLGRFLSPDPYVTDPTMSQDWNAYSYVSNSPMSFADPTGYVRAGPGCDLLTVMCAANDPGGGHSVISEPYQISGSFVLTVPVLTVDWGFVGGWGHGSDYGWGGWFPTIRVGVASFPVDFVLPGFLQSAGVGPTDMPMFFVGATGMGEGALWLHVYGALEAARRQRYERGPGLYVTGHRVLGVFVHLAIEYRNENNDPETLSAYPAGLLDSLVSRPDRPEDVDPGNNFTVGVLRPPENVAPGDYFRTLQEIDRQYH